MDNHPHKSRNSFSSCNFSLDSFKLTFIYLMVGREEDPGANLDGAKPGAWLARAPAKAEQSQDLCPILSMLLQALHSQKTVRTFTLRAVCMQVRSKVRGTQSFVLKPKRDYLFP